MGRLLGQILWILTEISNDYCIFERTVESSSRFLDLETLTLSPYFPVPTEEENFVILEVTPSKKGDF